MLFIVMMHIIIIIKKLFTASAHLKALDAKKTHSKKRLLHDVKYYFDDISNEITVHPTL